MAFSKSQESEDGSSSLESAPFLPNSNPPPPRPSQSTKWTLITTNALTFALTIILFTAITLLIQSKPAATRPKIFLHCGNTPAEARALGCTYDILSNLWVPTPCLDHETIHEFRTTAPWQGYSDPNGTRLLTVDEMSECVGDKKYWTPAREHLIHCSLMWKRLHKGYLTGEQILDANTLRYSHTLHCAKSQVELGNAKPEQLDQLVIATTAGFSTCEVENK